MKSVLLLLLSAWYSNLTSTQFVDDLEPQLKLNRDNYLGGLHTADRQAAALAFFDSHWNELHSTAACGSKTLGQPGIRCLQDRSRNGNWPWETWYRDPIQDTPLRK
jgi:hypothetical protein